MPMTTDLDASLTPVLGKAEPARPPLLMGRNKAADFYTRTGIDKQLPSPMTLLNHYAEEQLADSKFFWNALAGLPSPSPLPCIQDCSLLTSAAPVPESLACSSDSRAETESHSGPSAHAKYKSMVPSRLPIPSSLAYFTVPPGISPTTLLESPVFFNMMRVDLSPTTGSLCHAPKMEPFQSNLLQEETKDIHPENQGFVRFSSQPDPAAAVILRPDPAPLESSLLPASSIKFESTTGEAPELFQSVSQRNKFVGASAGVARPPDGFETSQASEGAPHFFNDRTVVDGYKWKKYGQKQLKGTEFPRSYYKCTHPNCPVKKQVECSIDGEITEILYKGEHNHLKPHGPHRGVRNGAQPLLPNRNAEVASVVVKQELDRFSADFSSTTMVGLTGTSEQSFGSPSLEESIDFEKVKSENEWEDEQDSKRRRTETSQDAFSNVAVRTIREPRVVVQTISDVDILEDGYRWRKYGQKIVKGKRFPRSYYKCTNANCAVRKHIERSSTDPMSVMTAYEGKHNHDVPASRNSVRETSGASTGSLAFTDYDYFGLSV